MKKLFKTLTAMASAAALTVSGAASCYSAVISSSAATLASATDDCNDDWLHAKGSRLYDKNGNEVWLTGANWFGFNCSEACPHYLWSADADDCLTEIADRGINVIRFPISTELIVSWMNGKPNKVSSFSCNTDPAYTINADFCEADGKTPKNSMEVFDIMMKKCKEHGIKAFIDIHSPHTDNSGHNYNLWYGKAGVTTEVWIDSLVWLAEKYKDDDTLIAYDLKNEPHGKGQEGDEAAKWDGSKDENNWAYAATRCADAILDVNPNALILVEGVEQSMSGAKEGDYWGMPDRMVQRPGDTPSPYIGAWWGGNFRGAREYPIKPEHGTSQIVYSPHDYGPSVYAQTWFHLTESKTGEAFDTQSLLKEYWYDTWAFINAEEIGPELIGEWGGHMNDPANLKWMTLLRDYMIDHHINHTFWCLNTNSGDTGGLWDGLGFMAGKGTTITWNEPKYELFEKALWQTGTTGKYIGLDHQRALGKNGISLNEYYSKYAKTEGSNLDGGKGGEHHDDPIPEVEKITVKYTPGDGSVKLSWNSVSNAQGYGVFKYEGSSWKKVTEVTGTSYTLKDLTAGNNYKVSVVAKIDGKLGNDYSNAITVAPNNNSSTTDLYPKVQTQVVNSKIGFKWTKVPGAEKYGIGVYQANKWKVVKQVDSTVTTWTSPQVANGTYRLVVLAKVNGAWVNADVFKKSFYVTVK
ncbi:cellulase family glycosylhydrolase [uncultured Ruminococcus sp.]|uniref:cellulase family glycosylhydrolase n=1 Tax=uncultured Ruminococcus sp. TaxID=165186 RepID=UPI0025E1AE6F|nr:cellulase family glycosylhydrolase [uncultured Ruminococcus sp.]